MASDALAWKETSSPTLTDVAAASIDDRRRRAVEHHAVAARGRRGWPSRPLAVWFGPFGLSGIDASAAITHAHTVAGPAIARPKSAVQVNVVDLPPPPGTEQAAL